MTIKITLNAFYNLALIMDVWDENSVKYTLIKKIWWENFPHLLENLEGIWCKVLYMRKGFLIYEEMPENLVISEETVIL